MAWLDRLLIPDPETGRTLMNWLRREATSHSAPQMVETLKVTFLLDAGVASWDSRRSTGSSGSPNSGGKPRRHQLQRMAPATSIPAAARSPSPPASHRHRHRTVGPVPVGIPWRCQTELIEFRKAIARSTNEKLLFLRPWDRSCSTLRLRMPRCVPKVLRASPRRSCGRRCQRPRASCGPAMMMPLISLANATTPSGSLRRRFAEP